MDRWSATLPGAGAVMGRRGTPLRTSMYPCWTRRDCLTCLGVAGDWRNPGRFGIPSIDALRPSDGELMLWPRDRPVCDRPNVVVIPPRVR
jgi:hypothetical protein